MRVGEVLSRGRKKKRGGNVCRLAGLQEAEAQRHGAALVIQRGFRRSKMSSLLSAKSRTEEELAAAQRKADELEVHRFRLEAQRVAGMALTGRQLLQQTSGEAEVRLCHVLRPSFLAVCLSN